MGKNISLLGDSSDHGGQIVSSNQDGTMVVGGVQVAVNGCQHQCPISGHGTTSVSAITVKSRHNSKLIITTGAVAGCGAKITSPSRGVTVE